MATSIEWHKGRRRSRDEGFIRSQVEKAVEDRTDLEAMWWKEGEPGSRWYSCLLWLVPSGPGTKPMLLLGATSFRALSALLRSFGLKPTIREPDIAVPFASRWVA